MSLDQAITHALDQDQVGPMTAAPPLLQLTRREREVAALIARGVTNRGIAERLVISERTADNHVANILSKLGLSTRAQVAVWAAEHGPSADTGDDAP